MKREESTLWALGDDGIKEPRNADEINEAGMLWNSPDPRDPLTGRTSYPSNPAKGGSCSVRPKNSTKHS